MQHFLTFSKLYTLAIKTRLTAEEISEIDRLATSFVRGYDELYYRRDPVRLILCVINVHSLLHLSQHIRDLGPAKLFQQFTMETYAGLIKPFARSKSQLSTSLNNEVYLCKQLNLIKTQLDVEKPMSFSEWPRLADLVNLSHPTLCRVQFHLRDLSAQLGARITTDQLQIFKRCILQLDLTIGSKLQRQNTDISRDNFCVVYLHKNCPKSATTIRFGEVKLFAQVNNFGLWAIIKQYRTSSKRLCLDRKRKIASYKAERKERWISVAWIKSLIGLIKEEGVNHVVSDFDIYADWE